MNVLENPELKISREEQISQSEQEERELFHSSQEQLVQSQTNWKTAGKVALGTGGGLFAAGVLPAIIGYCSINGAAITAAIKACMASVFALKSGLTVKGLIVAKTVGLNYLNYWAFGLFKMGGWFTAPLLFSIPLWGWLLILAGIGGVGYLVYKKWDAITNWVSQAWNKVTGWFGWKKPVERAVEEVISQPITENIFAPYIVQETEPERETRQLSTEISSLRTEVENLRTEIQEAEERDSETIDLQEQREQLEQTKNRLKELEKKYNNIPVEVRCSSLNKSKKINQFQNHLTRGTVYFFFFLIILAFISLAKLLKKLFGWTKKKHEETLEKIHQQMGLMTTELQVQRLKQAVEQINQVENKTPTDKM